MVRRAVVAAICLALVGGACGGDDGPTPTSEGTVGTSTTTGGPTTSAGEQAATPIGVPATEALPFDVFADLPVPPDEISTFDRPPLAPWDGSAVLIGPAGGLVRLGSSEGAETTPTEGIDVGDGTDRVRAVDLLASDGETLLAMGQEQDLVADVEPATRPFAWRSADGESWEALELTGLDSGTDTVTVSALVGDPGGGYQALGEVDDGDQTTLTHWTSTDGETWEAVDAPGLDHTDTEEEGEGIVDLATTGDRLLAVREDTGLDDSRVSLMRSTGQGWRELEPTGLEALDLPNSDILPPLTAVGDRFVLFASVPVEPDGEFGERRPTLFTSTDGEVWRATELEGPVLPDPFFVQAITATDGGAVAVAEDVDALNVWRFTRD